MQEFALRLRTSQNHQTHSANLPLGFVQQSEPMQQWLGVAVGLLGAGAWEAALCNTLSAGDEVLMFETGHFATLWQKMALSLGLKPQFIGRPGIEGWRGGVDAKMIEDHLRADKEHRIKAVCVVHNETSTGVTSDIASVRKAIDAVIRQCGMRKTDPY